MPALPVGPVMVPWPAAGPSVPPDHLLVTYQVILLLAWHHDRVRTPPVSRRELAALRGLALRTIDYHLHALRQGGLLADEPGRTGHKLVLIPYHLAPTNQPTPRAIAGGEGLQPTAAPAAQCAPSTAAPATQCAQSIAAPATGGDEQESQTVNDWKTHDTGPPLAGAARGVEEEKKKKELQERVVCIQQLRAAGVYPEVAQSLARCPWVTPRLIEAWVGTLRRKRQVRHLGAVLASVLGDPARCLPPPAPQPGAPALPRDPPPAVDSERADLPAESDHTDHAQPVERDERSPPHLAAAWADVLQRLVAALGQPAVELWLAGSAPLSLEDGILVVAVASARAVDWLSGRHADLCQAATAVLGEAVQVRLVPGRGKRAGSR